MTVVLLGCYPVDAGFHRSRNHQRGEKTMAAREEMNSLKRTARIAGALILIMTVPALFAFGYVGPSIIVPGDATATANNMMASEGLFRLGIASDALVFLIEIATVVMLYVLLKPVSKTLSLVAAFSRLAMTAVQGVNLLNHLIPMLLLSGAGYLTVFEPDQLHALVLLFLNAFEYGAYIWGLFFALHLFFLGYLVYKSGYIPRILGVLLVVSSLCYVIQCFGNILFPGYKEVFSWVGWFSIVEVAFPLWLVVKGIREQPRGDPAS
jgi:hypothetical protein